MTRQPPHIDPSLPVLRVDLDLEPLSVVIDQALGRSRSAGGHVRRPPSAQSSVLTLVEEDAKKPQSWQIATREVLDDWAKRLPLPAAPTRPVNDWRYKKLSLYRRMFIVVFSFNLLAVVICAPFAAHQRFTLRDAATALSVNIFVTTLMRHENYINLLFWLIPQTPRSAPVPVRRFLARFAYSQGGIHSGAGASSMLWLIFYIVLTGLHFNAHTRRGRALVILSTFTGATVLAMVLVAHPILRRKYHDIWERVHRYGGYLAISMIWAQVILTAILTSPSVGHALVHTPAFWFLVIISCFIAHPYLYLRRRTVNAQKLSNHATRLWFDLGLHQRVSGVRLSHDLSEFHSFATIPNSEGTRGYSVLISHAGDWTRDIINNPPAKIWMKGAPTSGVLRVAKLFSPCVIVATGSGIGPCLSFLHTYPEHPVRLVWSARSPEQTYGQEIMESVHRADPDALIIDTKATGHPDMEALVYALYVESKAEAIAIISNPKVTQDVVFSMEKRGIPAFGAIFDS